MSTVRKVAVAVASAAILHVGIGTMPARAVEPPSAATAKGKTLEDLTYALLLLRDPEVRGELKIDKQGTSTLDTLIAEVEYPLFLSREASAEDRASAFGSIDEKWRRVLETLLTAPQRARLDQLVFQARGSAALISPDIIARLGLSNHQVAQITKLRAESSATAPNKKPKLVRRDRPPAASGGQQGSVGSEATLAVLSDRQRVTLAELSGKPFDLSGVKWVATAAPELRDVETWFNSDPLELKQLRGKVVIVHFWAFGCINCIHNLPCYQRWYETFPADRVTIIGIHTPETESERSAENLRQKVVEYRIKYPVAFDAKGANWNAWANRLWPSVYLIDKQGRVRSWWTGELNWQGAPGEEIMRQKIESLLDEK
jgi:peroxiredoxin